MYNEEAAMLRSSAHPHAPDDLHGDYLDGLYPVMGQINIFLDTIIKAGEALPKIQSKDIRENLTDVIWWTYQPTSIYRDIKSQEKKVKLLPAARNDLAERRSTMEYLLDPVLGAKYQDYLRGKVYIADTFGSEFTSNIIKMVEIAQNPHVLPADVYKFGTPYTPNQHAREERFNSNIRQFINAYEELRAKLAYANRNGAKRP